MSDLSERFSAKFKYLSDYWNDIKKKLKIIKVS